MKSWMFKKSSAAVNSTLTLILIFLLSCAPESKNLSSYQNTDTESANIIGGVTATSEYQKQNGIVGLTIMIKNQSGQESSATCTGTLIAKNIILTAAHCIADSGIKAIAVIFAVDKNQITKEYVRLAADAVIHPNFLKDVDSESSSSVAVWNDIALLKLTEDAPIDFKFARLHATLTEINLLPNSKVTLAGFGITNAIVRKIVRGKNGSQNMIELPSVGSGVLRKVEGIVVKQVTADQKEILLDQKKLKGACHGDSGGPAFVATSDGTSIQVGVTSRGTEKLGNCTEGAIYTGVAGHLDWIKEASAGLNKTAEQPVITVAK